MSDLKRLDEALRQWTDYRLKRDLVPILDPVETEALLTAFTAARAYRDLLAKGQRVEWCEEHQRPATDTTCGAWTRRSEDNYNDPTGVTGCRIVSKLLIGPIAEVE